MCDDSLVNYTCTITFFPHLLCCGPLNSQLVSSLKWTCLCILRIEICVMSDKLVSNDHTDSAFPHLLCCELPYSVGKFPLNGHACAYIRIEFCVMSGNLVNNDHIVSFPHLPFSESLHFQIVSCLWRSMFVCTQGWFFLWWVIYSLIYKNHNFSSPLAIPWTIVLSVGKLPLKKHVCTYSRLNFVWWVIAWSITITFFPTCYAVDCWSLSW